MKCPNAQCGFRFDPAKVPPRAVVVCPRCGRRFHLGSRPAAGYPATGDFVAGDVPGIPSATDQTLPVGSYSVATPGPVAPPAPPDVAAPPPRRKSSGFGSTLLTLAGLLTLLSLAAGVVVFLAVVKRGGLAAPAAPPGDTEVRVPDRNFAYTMPATGWRKDNDTQNEMGVNVFALQRDGTPAAWVALAVLDYETRAPLPGELRAETLRHLNRLFEDVPQDLAAEPARWGPHDARKLFFRAERKGTQVACVGEAYEMTYKGVGYWFTGWAAETDAAALSGEFEAMRGRLRTLDQREAWVGAAVGEATFRSVKPSSRFRLTTPEKIWAAAQLEPTDEDPAAELLLKGVLKGGGRRDFNPEALAVVMVVPGAGEATEVAEGYVRKRHTRDPAVFGPTAITEVTGEPAGDAPAAAGLPARRLKVRPGGPDASSVAEKLVVFAAMRSGDSVVIAEADCPWSQKDLWERRLVQLVGSLRP